MRVSTLVVKIQSVLSPNLLYPYWREVAKTVRELHNRPFSGHCYHSSEALYHLWGKQHGYKPYFIEVEDPELGWIGHWYLSNGEKVIDITAEQFAVKVNYKDGRSQAFLTKKPSKRAQEVIRRLQA